MKLFLTWLLGVPLMVAAMVVARAMTPQGLEPRPPVAATAHSTCKGKGHVQTMEQAVIRDGHRLTCRHAVQR